MSDYKLLMLCDDPNLSTGYATVARNLIEPWHASGFFKSIDVWANGYNGRPHDLPCRLFPGNGMGRSLWYEQAFMQAFLDLLLDPANGYTHVWIMQDLPLLSEHAFPAALRAGCEARGIISTLYFPADASLEANWAWVLEAFDHAVAYTHYGKAEARKWLGLLADRVTVTPHGVDQKAFRPLPEVERVKLRAEFFSGWLRPGEVLLVNVNANNSRKDLLRSLQILAECRARNLPVKLYIHSVQSNEQMDLEQMGRQLGLKTGEYWQHGGAAFRKGYAFGGIPVAEVNQLYNTADYLLTTTLGEGWGLSITEALVAGCPVIAPDHTACGCIGRIINALERERIELIPLEAHGQVQRNEFGRVRYRMDLGLAVNRIGKLIREGRHRVRTALDSGTLFWLRWDRIAEKFMELFRMEKPGRHHYLEYGGGLGDVFQGMYERRTWNILRDLNPGDVATVVLACHNPYAFELLEWHPRKEQMRLRNLPYWNPPEEEEKRKLYELPAPGALFRNPERTGAVEFYPSPADHEFLATLPRDYLVLSASAGELNRNFPAAVLGEILEVLRRLRIPTVVVGRNYPRNDRFETPVSIAPGGPIIDAIDKLSVPGVAVLVQRCLGIITCHSALSLLAWYESRPMLLLYDERAKREHIDRRDQWAFGVDSPLTVHTDFKGWSVEYLHQFLAVAGLPPMQKENGKMQNGEGAA